MEIGNHGRLRIRRLFGLVLVLSILLFFALLVGNPELFSGSELDQEEAEQPASGEVGVPPADVEEADSAEHNSAEDRVAPPSNGVKYIPILCYHKFGGEKSRYSVTPGIFERQMKYLSENGYAVIPLRHVIERDAQELPDKPVVITMDDGFRSVHKKAYPILKKFGYPATLFIHPQYILSRSSNALTWEQMKEMTQNGVDVQSHSFSHPNTAKMRMTFSVDDYRKRLETELVKSKRIIEQNLGSKVDMFSYPYGVYDVDMEEWAKEAGYRAMVTTNREPNATGKINRWRLSRHTIFREDDLDQFAEKVGAQRLNLENVTPPDGSKISSRTPLISALVMDEIDPESVKVFRGEREIASSVESSGESVKIVATHNKALAESAYIITISARDKRTKQLMMGSWLFSVVPAAYANRK